jgi:hypothetical protein
VTIDNRKLQEALGRHADRRASLEDLRSLAADIGNQHYSQGIPVLLHLLHHEDDIVRYNAAVSICFELNYKPATDSLLQMLASDQDEDCRDTAASGLGNLWEGSREREIMTALAEAALNDTDEYVRRSAFRALQIVNGVTRDERETLRDENLAVEPSKIRAILSQASG